MAKEMLNQWERRMAQKVGAEVGQLSLRDSWIIREAISQIRYAVLHLDIVGPKLAEGVTQEKVDYVKDWLIKKNFSDLMLQVIDWAAFEAHWEWHNDLPDNDTAIFLAQF